MNLLHAVIFLCIENHSAIAGAVSACFHFGVLLSYLTALAGLASAARFLFRRFSNSR
jgi:ABC-type nickel/cobalt efflux system permease component RcnA